MARPGGEPDFGVLRLDFDRRLKLEFHGSQITSDIVAGFFAVLFGIVYGVIQLFI